MQPAQDRRADDQDHLDVDMQATADNAVRAHVFQRDQAIGALAVVEPGTGNVKAIAQSRPMGRNKRAGETYLNYVGPAEVRRLAVLPGRVDVQGRSRSRPRSSRASR